MNKIKLALLFLAGLHALPGYANDQPQDPSNPGAVKDLIRKLEAAKDEMERAAALDQLLLQGPKGFEGLQQSLSAKGARLGVLLDLDKNVAVVGKPITGKGFLVNTGTSSFWQRKESRGCHATLERIGAFGIDRGCLMGHHAIGGRRIRRAGDYNPIRSWYAIRPKEIGFERSFSIKAPAVGIFEVVLNGSVETTATIQPQIPGTKSQTIPLRINHEIAEDKRKAKNPERVFVLPDFENLPNDPYLNMVVSSPWPRRFQPGDLCPIAVTLANKRSDVSVRLERRLPVFGWYVVLNEKGQPEAWDAWLPDYYACDDYWLKTLAEKLRKDPDQKTYCAIIENQRELLRLIPSRGLEPKGSITLNILAELPREPATLDQNSFAFKVLHSYVLSHLVFHGRTWGIRD